MLILLLQRFLKVLPELGTQRTKFGKKILNGSKWFPFHAQRQAHTGLHKRDSCNQKRSLEPLNYSPASFGKCKTSLELLSFQRISYTLYLQRYFCIRRSLQNTLYTNQIFIHRHNQELVDLSLNDTCHSERVL